MTATRRASGRVPVSGGLKHAAIAVRVTAQAENFQQITVDYESRGKGGFVPETSFLHYFRGR